VGDEVFELLNLVRQILLHSERMNLGIRSDLMSESVHYCKLANFMCNTRNNEDQAFNTSLSRGWIDCGMRLNGEAELQTVDSQVPIHSVVTHPLSL
jgi:hypothetical protein